MIRYVDVEKLGFKRVNASDFVFEERHGFGYFTMTKKLMKGFVMEWDQLKLTVELLKIDKDDNIIKRIEIDDLEILMEYYELLKKIK